MQLLGSLLFSGCSSGSSTAGVGAADAGDDTSTVGSDDGGSDAAAESGPPGPFPAPHPTAPTVVNVGGDILTAPRLVVISFAGDPNAPDMEAFAAAIGQSSYWSEATKEYGIGPAVAVTPIHIPTAAPTSTTDGAIQTLIAMSLEGTSPAWGAPDKSAIYTVFYPSTTRISAPDGISCQTFGGYHSELALADKTPITYAVIPTCDTLPVFPWPGAPKGIDAATAVASHEWVEVATDPHIVSNPAFVQPDNDHLGWVIAPGSELGDMCGFNPNAHFLPMGFAHPVQRIWSNAAALAGHDPCVPHVSAQPYFNSAPVLKDTVSFNYFGQPLQALGVQIPVGTTKTVEVDLFSDAPTSGPWTVTAVEPLTWVYVHSELTLSFDKNTGYNGDKINLSITVNHKDGTFGAEPFAIVSTLGDESNIWYGLVGN